MMRPLEPDDPRAAGEFRLRARLGSGGMGQVYLGYSPAGRAVAVKVCHPEFAADQEFVTRFAREVAAARSVNGLFTAQVVGAGLDDSPPWLATSYVPGPSLHDAVTTHGPLPGAAVWRLAAGLAEALQAVHAHGLVHRDLKPSNVLLAADGPRVIDFGIARALDGTSLTATGYAFGTPGYMSPEQAEGGQATPASDIFALGSVLCFAATGDTPYGDGEPAEVLYRVVHADPALDDIQGPLRDLIAWCLARDPADRPDPARVLRTCQAHVPRLGSPSASFWPGQVAALISRYQAGLDDAPQPPETELDPVVEPTQSVIVRPPDTSPEQRQPVSRRRALAGIATAGVAAGLGIAGWMVASSGTGHASPASQLLWARATGGPVSSGAALADGIVYIGSGDGKVHAFEAATGKPVATFATDGAVSGGVVVAGGTLYAGSADHRVYAFRVGPGGKSWTYRTGGPVNCTPAIEGDTVYIGSDDGYVYALDAGTGRLAWRYRTGGPVRSQPRPGSQLYSGSIYVGSGDGNLYALGTGGQVQWRFATSGPVTAGLVYALGGVDVCDGNGRVYSIYDEGPPKAWEAQVTGAVHGTPAFSGDDLYIGSAGSAVTALNVYGGFRGWRYPTSGPVNSGLTTDGASVYAGDDHGYLYAIDLGNIAALWRYRAGGAIRSQLLTANGVIYFGSLDHHVYALREGT